MTDKSNKSPERVRIGLVGTGAVAQVAHLPAYRHLRNAELIAICDSDATKLRALHERTAVRHAVSSLDDLLAIDEIDAVDICLPSQLHFEAVHQCLAAGKHVLCEKPLALTAGEVGQIIDAQKNSGRVVLVGMNNRYRDDSILLKKFIEDGALGDVFYARADWLKRRAIVRPDSWHYHGGPSGGGVIMDLGIQLLDLLLWLCDYPTPERVTASYYHNLAEVEVEDTAVIRLNCAGGLAMTIEVSWSVLMDEEKHSVHLFGSEGSGSLNPIQVYQRMHGKPVNVTPQAQRRMGNIFVESYQREIAFFAEVVAGREAAPDLDEQLTLARTIAAVERSAMDGREIVITEE